LIFFRGTRGYNVAATKLSSKKRGKFCGENPLHILFNLSSKMWKALVVKAGDKLTTQQIAIKLKYDS